ncbi:O-methyltransferase ZRP4-like isoform X2 [Panicum hallii]|uniref:O-methyltransferase ZRP4-like isoform X2 n=1 Tax=Panicum hallii TaxID=206008 RepID=UPI000DF4EB72|nr:O-methyltransferase ZRP4-like isoform X2 [Panicum hallii]
MALTMSTNQALLDAQLELWHNTFGYIKSMALKSALDLRIADAIHSHGGGATLPQIGAAVKLHPSKIPCLRRLMRVLAASGILSAQSPSGGAEPVYALTPVSRLLVGSQNLAPFTAMILDPAFVSPFLELGTWFQNELPEPCVFKHTHGRTLWEHASRDATFDALVNDSMVSDSHFIMDIAIKECPGAFQGISFLVDVGGGLGAAAQAISKAFPGVKCSVLDLDHVVAKAPSGTGVQYIAGDMFESVPPADAIFFKEDCVKILKNCKKAIPPREDGGKVIIIDIVVEDGSSNSKHTETQALFDLYMTLVNGMERDEQEWKSIFFQAGFSDYKISPVLGARSIIEVYP